MFRVLIFAALIAGVALAVPQLVGGSTSEPKRQARAAEAHKTAHRSLIWQSRTELRPPIRAAAMSYCAPMRAATMKARSASMGAPSVALIDTGASVIAISRSTARKLGVNVAESDFKYRVSTANGVIPAARVVLRRVELQSIRVNNVEALVIDDKSLATVTLIGMSFLNKLDSYQARNGRADPYALNWILSRSRDAGDDRSIVRGLRVGNLIARQDRLLGRLRRRLRQLPECGQSRRRPPPACPCRQGPSGPPRGRHHPAAVSRPPPSATTASPRPLVSMVLTNPLSFTLTSRTTGANGRWSV